VRRSDPSVIEELARGIEQSFMAQRTVTEGKGHVPEVNNASHAVLASHREAVEHLINAAIPLLERCLMARCVWNATR
jgi:hypothetical protein